MRDFYKVAVDGPAGAGKSTIAKIISKKYKLLYIDSGAMYRCVALYLIKNKLLDISDKKLRYHLRKINIEFKTFGRVLLNGRNVTKEIRKQEVNNIVSNVATKGIVRREMVLRQRNIALKYPAIMDGRDIGTVVFKDANLKIYLTASPEERAKRRKKDLQKLGINISLDKLIKEIQERDNLDSTRKIAPLSKAHDAIVIDSTNLTISEVVDKIDLFMPT